MVHEYAHIVCCRHFNGYIKDIQLSIIKGNQFTYNAIINAKQVTWIAYAPLYISPIVSFLVYLIYSLLIPSQIILWISLTFLVTAIPSWSDAQAVLNAHSERTRIVMVTEYLLPFYKYWYYGIDLVVFLAIFHILV